MGEGAVACLAGDCIHFPYRNAISWWQLGNADGGNRVCFLGRACRKSELNVNGFSGDLSDCTVIKGDNVRCSVKSLTPDSL